MQYIRTNIYLTPVQKAALQELAAELGIKVAELVRRIIDQSLEVAPHD